MKGSIASLFVVASVVAGGHAYAQETAPGPGKLEMSLIPGGGTWFVHKDSAPKFGSYDAGAGAAYNFSRVLGVEGEVAGSFGVRQRLNAFVGEQKTPNMMSYNGNLVANFTGRSVVPYATAGVGGLSMFSRSDVDVNSTESYFTGNIGGGVKWFAQSGRWGCRGDYRLLMTQGKDNSAAFFGSDNRYANRLYGAVILNAVK